MLRAGGGQGRHAESAEAGLPHCQQRLGAPAELLQNPVRMFSLHARWLGGRSVAGNVQHLTTVLSSPHRHLQFTTWHRAQLLTFERVLLKRARELAQAYSRRADAAKWCEAATQLALPYFEWAGLDVQRTGLPAFFEQARITVEAPGGRKTISNPLKGYTIPRRVSGVV